MTKLTEKQQAFVTNRLAGVGVKAAAIAAGYSERGADTAGARLLKHPDVKAALGAAGGVGMTTLTMANVEMPRDHYDDPKDFLQDVINHAGLPHAMRLDAAKQLMPYVHGRIGEKGKKATAKERATAIAGGESKFATKQPPMLHVVKTNVRG